MNFILFILLVCTAFIGSDNIKKNKPINYHSKLDTITVTAYHVIDTIYNYVTWYGSNFHGRRTANGEIYNMESMTAAHKSLPFNTMVRVIDPKSQNSVIVRINDRCPKNNVLDLSKAAQRKLIDDNGLVYCKGYKMIIEILYI